MGGNDGIVSTASLLIGVAAAGVDKPAVLLAGTAGLVAGAMSMAAGEYVSVSSQADTERADLETEKKALIDAPAAELAELAAIYKGRGLDDDLAREVAKQLTALDALGAHARDELGISEIVSAQPLQAAASSGLSFFAGALLPLGVAALVTPTSLLPGVAIASLASLTLLGILSAKAGGASIIKAVARIVFWGAAAMAMTRLAGVLIGQVV